MHKAVETNRPRSWLRSLIFYSMLLVLVYAGSKIVPVVVKTFRFAQAMQHEVRNGPINESTTFIQRRLVAEADRLGLDLRPEDLSIQRNGAGLRISASYVVTVKFAEGWSFDWHFAPSYRGVRRPTSFGGSGATSARRSDRDRDSIANAGAPSENALKWRTSLWTSGSSTAIPEVRSPQRQRVSLPSSMTPWELPSNSKRVGEGSSTSSSTAAPSFPERADCLPSSCVGPGRAPRTS